jgi:hypothetical protein
VSERYDAAALRQALFSIRKAAHFARETVDSEGKWESLCESIIRTVDSVTPNNAPGADILNAILTLQVAWDQFGSCVDEFEPEDMSACSEYRGLLDDAILQVLKVRWSSEP